MTISHHLKTEYTKDVLKVISNPSNKEMEQGERIASFAARRMGWAVANAYRARYGGELPNWLNEVLAREGPEIRYMFTDLGGSCPMGHIFPNWPEAACENEEPHLISVHDLGVRKLPACEVSDSECSSDTHKVGDLWFCDVCTRKGYKEHGYGWIGSK